MVNGFLASAYRHGMFNLFATRAGRAVRILKRNPAAVVIEQP